MTSLTATSSPAIAELSRVVARAFAPSERLTVSEWADKYRVITKESGAAEPGPWRTARVPYLRAIMDAYSDPAVRRIVIMKREQVGGTEASLNMAMYAIDTRPSNSFWIWSNEDNARDFNQKRFIPTVRACAKIAGRLSSRKSDARALDVTFEGATFWMRGAPPNAGGVRKLESHAARDIFNDELDRCDIVTPDVMLGRSTTFPHTYKHIFTGTPGNWGEGIHLLYMNAAGGGLRYWVPCPHCAAYFVRDFSGVKWLPPAGGGRLDAEPELVRRQAWYACPACGGAIYGHHSRSMLAKGVWAPGWDESRSAAEQAKEGLPAQSEIDAALHAPSVGFWIGEFENPFQDNPYGEIAAEYVRNGGYETQEWTTRRRGRPYRLAGERLKSNELMTLCKPVERGGYSLGTVPRSTCALVGTVDVQGDRIYYLVEGFTARMRRSWLVDFGCRRFERPGGILDNLDVLRGVVERVYAFEKSVNAGGADVAKGREGNAMRVSAWGVDSGFETLAVYSALKRLGGRAREMWATKGMPGTGAVNNPRGYVRKWVDADGVAKELPPAMQTLGLVQINTWMYKDLMMDRLKLARARISAGAVGGDDGIVGAVDTLGLGGAGVILMFPEAAVEQGLTPSRTSHGRLYEFFCSLCYEERQKVPDSRGNLKYEWRKAEGVDEDVTRAGNHYWDCYVAVHALAFYRKLDQVGEGKIFGVVTTSPAASGGEREEAKPEESRGGEKSAPERRSGPASDYWEDRRRRRRV